MLERGILGRGREAGSHWLRRAEYAAWGLALVLGCLWAGARGLALLSKESALGAFEEKRAEAATPSPGATLTARAAPVDQTLWDRGRIRAYLATLARPEPPPLAVLHISRFHLEVPVLEGTDEWTLDRAVGHIQGTASPGAAGNVGIAGHRDGFFRVLKDITTGDAIELVLQDKVQRYRVQQVSIVGPEEVGVLASSKDSLLTLVTCYPFYFVGSAPQRFIVRAKLIP